MGTTLTLTGVQIMILTVIAMLIVQGVKIIAAKQGKTVDRKLITVILFLLSVVIAFFWAKPVLPTWPAPSDDPTAYAMLIVQFFLALFGVALTILGFSKIVYDWLLAKVFDLLGIGSTKVDAYLGKPITTKSIKTGSKVTASGGPTKKASKPSTGKPDTL